MSDSGQTFEAYRFQPAKCLRDWALSTRDIPKVLREHLLMVAEDIDIMKRGADQARDELAANQQKIDSIEAQLTVSEAMLIGIQEAHAASLALLEASLAQAKLEHSDEVAVLNDRIARYGEEMSNLCGELDRYDQQIPTLTASLDQERQKNQKLGQALGEIAIAKPIWLSGAGSYSGGETYYGFAQRLINIAVAACAIPSVQPQIEAQKLTCSAVPALENDAQ